MLPLTTQMDIMLPGEFWQTLEVTFSKYIGRKCTRSHLCNWYFYSDWCENTFSRRKISQGCLTNLSWVLSVQGRFPGEKLPIETFGKLLAMVILSSANLGALNLGTEYLGSSIVKSPLWKIDIWLCSRKCSRTVYPLPLFVRSMQFCFFILILHRITIA